MLFALCVQGQIDNKNNSFSIPAVKSPKDSTNNTGITPIKPITPQNNQNSSGGLNLPKNNSTFEFPKKEFSMFSDEEFGNPGELYQDRINQSMDKIKNEMQEKFLKGEFCKGILFGIEEAGKILSTYFPIKPDDINELSNRVNII